jgi:hypothetical protein
MSLRKNKILKILELTKVEIRERHKKQFGLSLCDALSHSYNSVMKPKSDIDTANFLNIKELFPLFSLANAKTACKAKKEKQPYKVKSVFWSYWWDSNNKDSRIAYLNWMIEQTEKMM